MTRADIIATLDGTHPRVGRGVALAIHALIVASAVVIAVETLPALSDRAQAALVAAEIAIVAAFTMEYALSFRGLVDFVAVVPALLVLFPDLAPVRMLRLLRLPGILTLFKANRALDRIARALDRVKPEVLIFIFIACVALHLAAAGIDHVEHAAQPEAFGSIPESLWWAVATLTTVGYGDVYPITAGGRVFTGVILLIGIGVIAVPAGLITAALAEANHGVPRPAPHDLDPGGRAEATGAQTAPNPSSTEDTT